MAGFRLNTFSGMRPRVPDSLLSANEASYASNCDFAYGELRNIKNSFQFNQLTNSGKSLYTDDGVSFFSWDRDVDAVRSPLASDTFNRLYYTGDNGFKVTNRLGTRTNGGAPASSYVVGVPRPGQAPVLEVTKPKDVNSTTANIAFKFHYEYGGVKYQEQDVSTTAVNNTQYQFTPPTAAEGTPTTAFPVLRVTATWKEDNSQVFDIYTDNSSFYGSGGLYSLSMSKDATGGTYTATLTLGIREEDKETRAYVYVYRNIYNEQGPPSSPTLVTTTPVMDVFVTARVDIQTKDYAPIKYIDVFRTPTGSTIAEYFYVGSISVLSGVGTFSMTDNVKTEMLNEPLSSTEYYPPDESLVGLMALPNGILCAWKGNELHFSEAYKPWAWPPSYVKVLENAVVGGIVHGAGAVITTTVYPYAVSGVSPDSMTLSKINVNQAGVSKHSIAVVDGVVMYASNDGLVALNGITASLAQSHRFFTRETWRTLYGSGFSNMRFAVWDGRLIVYCTSGSTTRIMIRFDEADGTLTYLDVLPVSVDSTFVSKLSDQLYYVSNGTLYQFAGASAVSAAVWTSGERVLPTPVNFGAAQAIVTGTWVLSLQAYIKDKNTGKFSWVTKHTQPLPDGLTNFRLPSGYESDRYKVSISGTGRFRELRVAQTARELATL